MLKNKMFTNLDTADGCTLRHLMKVPKMRQDTHIKISLIIIKID